MKFTPYYLKPPNQKYMDYAKSLFINLRECFLVDRKYISKGDWKPLQNECHQNCTDLADLDERYKPVRGWLCFNFGPIGFYRFTAHSIVEDINGNFIDITPTPIGTVYPFIKSNLSEKEYQKLIDDLSIAHGACHLDHEMPFR